MVESKTVLDKIDDVLEDYPDLEPEQFRYICKRLRNKHDLRVQQRSQEYPEYLEPSEVKEFYQAARELNQEDHTDKYLLVARLGINTGLRVSEMTALDVRDVKDEENNLHVVEGKGSKDRTTFIDDNTINLIRSYTDHRTSGPVFKVTKRSIQNWVKRIRERFNDRTGLDKDITPHTLRHTFATMQRYKGMDIEELKVLMGHSSVKTTEIYGRMQLNPEMREKYEKTV